MVADYHSATLSGCWFWEMLILGSWTWPLCFGFLSLDSWAWIPELESWVWVAGFGSDKETRPKLVKNEEEMFEKFKNYFVDLVDGKA